MKRNRYRKENNTHFPQYLHLNVQRGPLGSTEATGSCQCCSVVLSGPRAPPFLFRFFASRSSVARIAVLPSDNSSPLTSISSSPILPRPWTCLLRGTGRARFFFFFSAAFLFCHSTHRYVARISFTVRYSLNKDSNKNKTYLTHTLWSFWSCGGAVFGAGGEYDGRALALALQLGNTRCQYTTTLR